MPEFQIIGVTQYDIQCPPGTRIKSKRKSTPMTTAPIFQPTFNNKMHGFFSSKEPRVLFTMGPRFYVLSEGRRLFWRYKDIYTGCPQKAERRIFSILRAKNFIFLTSLNKASSAEDNDTKVSKFGWVILNLCPLLGIQSFSNFAWFLRPMSEELCRDKASIRCFWEAHIDPWQQKKYGSMGFHKPPKAFPFNYRSLVAKIRWHLKMTVFQEMGIESKLLN